jgi:hypothetical protein
VLSFAVAGICHSLLKARVHGDKTGLVVPPAGVHGGTWLLCFLLP